MPKRTIIYILLIVIALVAIIVGITLLIKPTAPGEEGVRPREFLPFPRFPREAEEGELLPTGLPLGPAEEVVGAVAGEIRLFKITDFPVAGAGFVEKEAVTNPEEANLPAFDFTNYPNLKLGASNTAVNNLQIILNRFLTKKELALLNEDGNFNGATKEAVILFQKEYNLTTDGAVGPKTKIALNKFQEPEVVLVPVLRFAAKNDGRIFETDVNKLESEQITGATIPRLAEAFFGESGGVLLRYSQAGEITTFLGKLTGEVFGQELPGTFIGNDLLGLALSPDRKNVFYLASAALGGGVFGSVGFTLDFATSEASKTLESAFTEWLVDWKDAIYLLTKPTFALPGYLYKFDSKTEVLNKILGGINGLSTLVSPNGEKILVSASENDGLTTQMYYISERAFSDLGLKTLPEKCVFNENSERIYCAVPKSLPGANYPDDWYQGIVSFTDSIWQIDASNFTTSVINDLDLEPIDAINLALDSDEKNLVFTNKRDGSLWLLKI